MYLSIVYNSRRVSDVVEPDLAVRRQRETSRPWRRVPIEARFHDGVAGRAVVFGRRLSGALVSLTLACADSPTAPSPVSCGGYPEQSTSPYVLPYEVGAEFVVGQGNCTDRSHTASSVFAYAYDFLMPIGARLVAVRSGTVTLVEERFSDGDRTPGHENFITVEHDDGTLAQYVHLTRGGVLVDVGDRVVQGDVIALSGDTGESTEPHLHLNVVACAECRTIPTVFRNTRPHPRGLQEGERYRAEAW